MNALTGPPIGPGMPGWITPNTFDFPERDAMLAFTDGLTKQRSRSVDQGLGRLWAVAKQANGALTVLVDTLVQHLAPNASVDNTAMPGSQWES